MPEKHKLTEGFAGREKMTRSENDHDVELHARAAVPIGGSHLIRSQAALLDDLGRRFAAGQGFAVATVNLDHLVKLRRDESFRAAYARQTHVTADGNPIVWLQRLGGAPVDLVTGSDLIDPLIALAARRGIKVAFFGSSEPVLAAAADRLAALHPGLQVVCRIAPPYGFDPDGSEAAEMLERIAASGARLCLVALGAPKQEKVAARGLALHPEIGFVSIGAGLDFIAGTQKRAPRWVRKLALEWLWRMLTDWKRLAARYRDCALILPGLAFSARRARRRG